MTKSEFPNLEEFIWFIKERWSMHQKRVAGKPAPWTDDEILRTYRFTNVRREDDRVTRWIHKQWLEPNATDPDLWFGVYVSRVLNRPSTMERVGWPAPWGARSRAVLKILRTMYAGNERIFSAAYLVSSHGRQVTSKIEYYAEVFSELWGKRVHLRPTKADTLQDVFQRLVDQPGIGPFMAAQVVCDLKFFAPLNKTADWQTFASYGPGSKRGLNFVCGREMYAGWPRATWQETHDELRRLVLPRLPEALRTLSATDSQNCLCEYSKYYKVKNGLGRARRTFTPHEDGYMQ
jgi:hypothetical protein